MYIPIEAVGEIKKRIESFNRKWNTNVSITSSEMELKEIELPDGSKKMIGVSDVNIHAPQIKKAREDVKLLEIVSIKNGVPSVSFKDTDKYIPYRQDECDHCHSKRARSLYYIIQVDKDVKQIGSSCIKEYLGESVYSIFSGFYNLLTETESLKDLSRGRTVLYSIVDIVRGTYKETDNFTKWISTKTNFGISERIKRSLSEGNYYTDVKFDFSESDQKDFVQHVLYKKSTSDSLSLNVAWSVLDENNNLRLFVPFDSIGVVSWAIFDFYRSKQDGTFMAEKKSINLVPFEDVSKDDTLSFEGEMTLLRKRAGDYGDYYEYVISDGIHCAFWRTSKSLKNGKVKVSGKVKGQFYNKGSFCTQIGGRVKIEYI